MKAQEEVSGQSEMAREAGAIGLDKLIRIHKDFLAKVIRRCMLDVKYRYMRRELNNIMTNVLEFRRICKKYFLCNEDDFDGEGLKMNEKI